MDFDTFPRAEGLGSTGQEARGGEVEFPLPHLCNLDAPTSFGLAGSRGATAPEERAWHGDGRTTPDRLYGMVMEGSGDSRARLPAVSPDLGGTESRLQRLAIRLLVAEASQSLWPEVVVHGVVVLCTVTVGLATAPLPLWRP
ncbi:hypothetical protein CDD83_10439 [Cordyceps sp. RAO-2017]|nr:hypothetical protein CDD83_10439 [Cordyceps sp. RAO-2017]